ncbi:sensor histidine kinase [Propionicimonas sp.]|uniref:sensor histidine kinase n=1 Tax=Propionicimonas sp. TaxID=1955623 RepID=UPI0039E6A640
MTTTPLPAARARAPLWVRGTRALEVAALVVIGIAVLVEFVIAATRSSPAGFASAAVIAAGVVVGYRCRPWAGLALVAVAPVVAAVTGWLPIHNWSIACFAGFLFALRGLPGLPTGLVVGVANLASVGWYYQTLSIHTNAEASIAAAAALALAATGSAIHSQRLYTAELEQRSREAIATREAAVDRSVAQERLRIARDLHDSIGHEIAVVSMHLGAAEVHLATDPAATAADLDAARAGVRSVLRETQDILRVLRVGEEGASLAPTPNHGRVAALVESYRAAGLDIDAELSGFDRPLPTGTSTAVFRIVQESLTNAERHGEGPVSLRADVGERSVVVEVVNLRRTDGRDTSGGGRGLVGMRERAESAGGQLVTRDDGRIFSVRAELPTLEQEDS